MKAGITKINRLVLPIESKTIFNNGILIEYPTIVEIYGAGQSLYTVDGSGDFVIIRCVGSSYINVTHDSGNIKTLTGSNRQINADQAIWLLKIESTWFEQGAFNGIELQGAQGAQGDNGATGDVGSPGGAGVPGFSGDGGASPQGPEGDIGDTGPSGAQGAQG